MAKAKKAKIKNAKQSTQLPLDDVRWRPVAEIVERLFPHISDRILIAHDLTEALASKKIRCMRRVVMGPADAAERRDIELEQQVLGAALLNQSLEVTLSAEHFSVPLHRQLFETIARVRALHGVITPQLIIASMGGDAGIIFADGITVGQYVEGLAAEASLPRNVPGHRELVLASFWVEHCFTYSNGDICVGVRPPNHHGPWSFTWTKSAFYLWQPDCLKTWPALASQAVAALEAEASEPSSPRRKPGRKPRGNWKVEVATEVGLHMRQGEPIPTAKALAQFCLDQLDYEPDISEIQKWLRQLLG
jgi:DnaB-like helicase N terminal domain